MNIQQVGIAVWCIGWVISMPAIAGDWAQFRGPNGIAQDREADIPLTFGESENLAWKTPLPGPGSSSPIIVGDRLYLTCYSGYGVGKDRSAEKRSLKRHLVSIDALSGKIVWTRDIAAELPEDDYSGFLTEHGYASGTPVADEQGVYAFFGKSGVVAFDKQGEKLWQVDVGKESSNRRWGTGSSLILHKNMVIVNAAEESQSIRALDKKTGSQVWKASGSALELSYGTPALVTLADQRQEIVLAVPGEVWGLNPETGKLNWFAEHSLTGNISPSVITQGDSVFVFGGFRSAGCFALKAGGKGDVTKSNLHWTGRNSSYVATPLLLHDHLYWIDDRGQAYCISAKDGTLIYRERVEGIETSGRPVYASPVAASGRIYVPTRWSGVVVLPAAPEYKILARNRFDDESDFNGTPAISHGKMYLRSNRFLYCVSK